MVTGGMEVMGRAAFESVVITVETVAVPASSVAIRKLGMGQGEQP